MNRTSASISTARHAADRRHAGLRAARSPDWGFSPVVTDDGRYLLVYQSEGTENKNRIFVQDCRRRLDAPAVPRRLRRLVRRRRQRRPDLLRGDRSRCAARQARGDRARRAAAGGMEDADRRGPRPRRARRGHDARRSLRGDLADRRAARAAGLQPGRRPRARDRAADARLGQLLVHRRDREGFYASRRSRIRRRSTATIRRAAPARRSGR